MGKITVGKTHFVALMIYDPQKNCNDTEQLFNKNTEGTIGMVQKAASHTLFRDGKVLTIGDFNYKETDS